jgi:hypothetical protein
VSDDADIGVAARFQQRNIPPHVEIIPSITSVTQADGVGVASDDSGTGNTFGTTVKDIHSRTHFKLVVGLEILLLQCHQLIF